MNMTRLLRFWLLTFYFPMGFLSASGMYAMALVAELMRGKAVLIKSGISAAMAAMFYLSGELAGAEVHMLTLIFLVCVPLLPFLKYYSLIPYKEKQVLFVLFLTLAFLIPFKPSVNMWLGYYYDRNVFGLIIFPFLLYFSKKYKYGFVFALVLAGMTGSRNVLLGLLVEKALSKTQLFRQLYKVFPKSIIGLAVSAPIAILLTISYNHESINFYGDRSYFNLMDASNMLRAIAMSNALEYLIDHPLVILFGGGWDHYAGLVDLRVHNTFFQIVIKHGIVALVLLVYYLYRVFREANIEGSIVVSLFVFSGILGGLGWGLGFYWAVAIVFLFGTLNRHRVFLLSPAGQAVSRTDS